MTATWTRPRSLASYCGIFALLLNASCGGKTPWDERDDDEQEKALARDSNLSEPKRPTSTATPGTPQRLEDYVIDDVGVSNLDEIITQLNLAGYHKRGYRGQKIKIAVLDNGFTGLTQSLGRRLPPGLAVEETSGQEMQDSTHGTKIAEIAYAVATGKASYQPEIVGPEMLLFNTNGFTNLKYAIDQVIAQKVDIVLYAQVWEYGGNMDGRGFINREIKRATDAGVLWVNAAGNFGQSTYNAAINIKDDGSVALPYGGRWVRLVIPQDRTPVKIVLSWNDFTDEQTYKSEQDLNLALFASDGKRELASSKMAQVGTAEAPADKTPSSHAREIIATTLDVGTYLIGVSAQSKNFRPDSTLRLSVDGLNVRLIDRTDGNSVLIPADSDNVLSIGAADVAWSSWRSRNTGLSSKPDVSLFSRVTFDGGEEVQGTSAASAIAVGAIASFASATGIKGHERLKALFQGLRTATRNPRVCAKAADQACSKAPIMLWPDLSSR